ncbi:right-handed parallel beta-helix repeat-containing protein [Clostridium oryzae]|uniref:Plasmin and fibronectin-binding protein A n=1 Tax=Clostridium oryzae TaxID=1450648 RepID=A0A1V4IHU2_9CLOT|nr:right-handed parallel beta-helix repeat-containing protein [Clostridium oryzae]OPJ59523.1 plasmin and fibronectin-binding protein A precursor [Clostridium oryzae]
MITKFINFLTAIVVVVGLINIGGYKVLATDLPNYCVSPSSKAIDKKILKYTTYNKYTKNYYMLRSYLERLEKKGGGTLILKSGTYTISNVLFVPSNVTIILKDGVKLVKGNKTGTSKFVSSHSMFQLIRPSYSAKKGIYGEYNGEKNIRIIGEGTAIIDMKYYKEGMAIIAGHNTNLTIENIHFKNINTGHFIEIDATQNATIANNRFEGSKPSPNLNKEAINIDTPDRTTNGWSQQWSKYDKTPDKDIYITNNEFINLDRAVGTHKYSGGEYHQSVVIRDNKIENTRSDAIRVMNWKDTVIENNEIKNVANKSGIYRGILASGAINPTIQGNFIEEASRPIQFMPWKNSGPGSKYDITYNVLSQDNEEALKNNVVSNVLEGFIRINNEYNVYDRDTIKINIQSK